jgi:hypothetical protein
MDWGYAGPGGTIFNNPPFSPMCNVIVPLTLISMSPYVSTATRTSMFASAFTFNPLASCVVTP